MKSLFLEGLKVAKTYDVCTPKDSLVVYSVSFLPNKKNRDDAFAYVNANRGKMMIEHTPCGAKRVELGFASSDTGLNDDDVALIWKEASKRLIDEAAGNITAFVDNADPRSVFCSMELPALLGNSAVTTVNGIDKFEFAKNFKASKE